MNIFEFHALSVYLQRNLWHIFSINTLNGETIFTCQLWNHPRNTRKNLKDDFETMVKPWLGRDIHGWKPCWLKANLPAEVGGTLSSPKKRRHRGTSWYLNLIVFFGTQNAVFCSKQHARPLFSSDSNWTWKYKGLRFSQGFKQKLGVIYSKRISSRRQGVTFSPPGWRIET